MTIGVVIGLVVYWALESVFRIKLPTRRQLRLMVLAKEGRTINSRLTHNFILKCVRDALLRNAECCVAVVVSGYSISRKEYDWVRACIEEEMNAAGLELVGLSKDRWCWSIEWALKSKVEEMR